MSLPDDLPTAFAAFRDETRAELADVRALAETARSEAQVGRVNARLLQALRTTQVEHGHQLAELRSDVNGLIHGQISLAAGQVQLTQAVDELRTGQVELTQAVGQLRTGQVKLWRGLDEVRADVGTLKTDVTDIRTDVTDLKTGMAEVLRRLPPPDA